MVFKIGKKTLKQNVNFYVPSLPIKLGTFYLYIEKFLYAINFHFTQTLPY